MAKAKKPQGVDVLVRVPVPVIAYFEGVAAYAGVTVEQAMAVALAMAMQNRYAPENGRGEQ